MEKIITCIITLSFLFSGKGFSQSSDVDKTCYIKAVFLDSASGKATTHDFYLNKPLPTLMAKDTYACKCEIKTYEIVVIRGKRPLSSWKIESPYIRLSSLYTMVQNNGNEIQPGDRFMITVVSSFSGKKKCMPVSGGEILVGMFKVE